MEESYSRILRNASIYFTVPYAFTGIRFQMVILMVSMTGFLCSFLTCCFSIMVASPIHPRHYLFEELRIVCYIYLSVGLFALIWLVLDIAIIDPRTKRKKLQQEYFEGGNLQQAHSTTLISPSTRRRQKLPSDDDIEASSPEASAATQGNCMSLWEYEKMRAVESALSMRPEDGNDPRTKKYRF